MNSQIDRAVGRTAAVMLALLMVGTVIGSGTASEAEASDVERAIRQLDTQQAYELLMDKAEPALAERLEAGQTTDLSVVLTGPAHGALSEDAHKDRATAMAELDDLAAPFFDRVALITDIVGGDVVASWSAAPAIKVTGDLELLRALAALTEAWHFALDHEEVLGLNEDVGIGPIESDAPETANSEGRKMLEAEDIWAAGFEGAGIKISVIDTGIDAGHEAFKFADGSSRVVEFRDCVSGGCDDVAAYDDHGHGTHVAGTAAGSSLYDDPTYGVFQERGVAPQAEIYVAKFLSSSGGGSFEGAMDSLQWSFDIGADLTSNSWGGSCFASSSVVQLVNQLNDLGMLNVFAAGNSGSRSGTIGGPACADKALSIGAVDESYTIAAFSSRGPCSDPTTGTGSRICPDLVAKGVDVRSAIPRSGATWDDPSGYRIWDGTSMATPHAAGAVALIEEMKRHYDGNGWDTSNEAEKQILKLTAAPLGGSSPNNDYGWGHIKLLPVLAMLESSDEARIIDAFGISSSEIRLGESTTLSFSVRNLGGATATGQFTATLEHPDGTTTVIADEAVSLALLDGASATHVVTVAGDVQPGNYTFTGSFDYTWQNETGEQDGSVFHEGTFSVKRVFLDMELDGLDESVLPGTPQSLVFTVSSTGNEASFATKVEFTMSDQYVFVGGHANPAPDRVIEHGNGRITMVWDVGTLEVGESFSFQSDVVATLPGENRFLAVGKFQDGSAQDFGQARVWWQTVGL